MSRSGALTPARGLPAYAAGARGAISNGVYNLTPDNNRAFATALANAGAGTGACHDVFVGASDLAAYDGSTVRSPMSWPESYRQTLAAQGIASGGTGLLPACDTLGIPSDTRVATTGAWASFAGAFAYNGTSLTFTPDVGGRLVVAYTNPSPSFTVKIGAAAAVTVNPTGASSLGVWISPAVVPAGTACVLTMSAAGAALTHVGTVGAAGYHKHNLARSSMGATRGASPFGNATQGAWDPTVATDYYAPAPAAYATLAAAGVQAHRVTVSLGANDLTGGASIAQILAALPRIIAAVPKVAGATVRLVVPWQLGLVAAATWEAYAAALYAFADANGYQLVDWRALLGNYSAMQTNGVLGADNEHVTPPTWASFGRHVALNDLAAA